MTTVDCTMKKLARGQAGPPTVNAMDFAQGFGFIANPVAAPLSRPGPRAGTTGLAIRW